MDDALALDGVRALRVEVVGEEELLGAVEWAAAALGLLGAVVPAHPHPHAAAPIRLHPLHPRHVRRVVRVRRPHQHAVPHFTRSSQTRQSSNLRRRSRTRPGRELTSDHLVGALDGVGFDVPLPLLRLGHGGGVGLGANPSCEGGGEGGGMQRLPVPTELEAEGEGAG